MSDDPVDELAAVINETLRANGLRLTTRRGGYVGSGQPHASLDSDPGAVDNVARGLLARKVAEPSRALSSPETTPAGVLDEAALAEALYATDPPESWMRTGTDEYRKRAVAMLAVLAAALGRSGSGGGRG